ncbi:variable large family protein [Borrelia duttonii]|uniref:Variable large protein n=1 Tax=Borrelia duttonii (strain Ly) TaxID=412419 RepID=B5RNZ0_BORDL|nr:vlp protein, beta subfamily [Borrelia duttonii Ly]
MKEGKREEEVREYERGEIKRVRRIVKGIIMVMMVVVMGCNSGGVGGVEGKVNLEAKNSFLESLVAIGEGFQEIFGVFGNTVGDVLGFSVVKSGDKKSKVGEHFEKVKKGLEDTNKKLKELSGDISGAKNADVSTVETIKGVIKGVSDVFEGLIGALTKLSEVINDSAADVGDNADAVPSAAEKIGVESIIKNVEVITGIAKKSGVEIVTGNAGNQIAAAANATDAIAVLGGHTEKASQGAGSKLADEVSKADPWAMIDKIKNAKASDGAALKAGNHDAGILSASNNKADAGAGAKSNADLAAAVALKAMTKSGKFSASANDSGAVRAAGVSAVNKVLGVLDFIIKRTVESNLERVREAVKGVKYSNSVEFEAKQSDATQSTVTK